MACLQQIKGLEGHELSLSENDFEGKEALRQKILATLDEALETNENLSLDWVKGNGRLHQCLHEARHFIQAR